MRTTGVGGPSGVTLPAMGEIDAPGSQENRVGGGIRTPGGAVPDAPMAPMLSLMGITSAMRNFAPAAGRSDFEAALADITAKLRDTSGKVETDRITGEQEVKRKNMQENQAKIEESQEKLEKAEAKRKSGNIFQRIAQAFQALGAVLMAVVGAALMALPGFQAAGALMIASGALMLLSLVNSLVAEANGGAGLIGSIAKAFGGSEKLIMGLDMGFMGAVMVAGIALSFVTRGGADSAKEIGALGNLIKGVVERAMDATRTIAQTAQTVKNVGTAANITSSALQAGASVGQGALNYQAAQASASAQNLRADATEIQAMMQLLDDLIDQALQMLQQSNERFNSMLDTVGSMLKDSNDSVSNVRFAG